MKDTLVFDLETKKSFAEVGGERYKDKLGISVAGVYSYNQDAFFAYEENELDKFEQLLQNCEYLIGFNIIHFDIPVMMPYLSSVNMMQISLLDMYKDATEFLGHRVGLNALAKSTLGIEKSGHGLDALKWFRDGEIEKVKSYCVDDVRITRDLYEYGKKNGFVLFESYRDGKVRSVPVSWARSIVKTIPAILQDALDQRRTLAIEYISSSNDVALGYKKERLIDVYEIKKDAVRAYCHLRNEPRNFFIKRMTKAEMTDKIYVMPQERQATLF